MAVGQQSASETRCGLVHIGVGDVGEHVGRVEVGSASTWPDVHVRVRDLVTLDEHADPLRAELLPLCQPDEARDLEEMRCNAGLEIDPLVDLDPGHDHRVPELQRTDREERDADLVGPDEPTRDLAVDDASEQGSHGSNVAMSGARCDDGNMPRYVALLRGVNVGGVRIAMTDLRAAVEGLGYTDAATYLQSGNVTFTADGRPEVLGGRIRTAIAASTGIDPLVIVLTAQEWHDVVAANPYPEETEPTRLHAVVAARDFTGDERNAALQVRDAVREAASGDDLTVIGRVVYLHLPDGMGRSKLAEKLGRSKAAGQLEATARNWRTVLALAERLRG